MYIYTLLYSNKNSTPVSFGYMYSGAKVPVYLAYGEHVCGADTRLALTSTPSDSVTPAGHRSSSRASGAVTDRPTPRPPRRVGVTAVDAAAAAAVQRSADYLLPRRE